MRSIPEVEKMQREIIERRKLDADHPFPCLCDDCSEPTMGPKTAREMLDVLDEFLMSAPSVVASELWDVLTALRGPDSACTDVKMRTTGLIRTLAFPKTAALSKEHLCIYAFFGDPEKHPIDLRGVAASHFRSHITAAAVALGYPYWKMLSDHDGTL